MNISRFATSTIRRARLSRRAPAALLALAIMLGAVSTLSASSGSVNGADSPRPAVQRRLADSEIQARIQRYIPDYEANAPAGDVRCYVEGPDGQPTAIVMVTDSGDPTYSLVYESRDQVANFVEFVVVPLYDVSPVLVQVQRYDGDFSNVLSTPFGIPPWGLNKTSGPYRLVVRDGLSRIGACDFEVVPQG